MSRSADRDEVFLMNTFTDAQLIVSRDVSRPARRLGHDGVASTAQRRRARGGRTLAENGFIVESREADSRRSRSSSTTSREDTDQLRVTVLTTLQCNFACDYCIQGDHGDYNKHAAKMSIETAARVAELDRARMDAVRPKSFVADVLRRRAAPQSAGRCTTWPSGCGRELPGARRRR